MDKIIPANGIKGKYSNINYPSDFTVSLISAIALAGFSPLRASIRAVHNSVTTV